MTTDPFFDNALRREEELRELYEAPMERALRKELTHLDDMCARLIGAARMVLVGSVSADGRCDVSPRGGPPGFVSVLDEQHLAIPDATGNRRLDTLENIVSSGRAGLLFLIGGRDTTLRVNGAACVTSDSEVLESLSAVGKPPRTAIVVRAEEVYAHCPKAFVRSALWDPDSWPDDGELPTAAEVTLAHMRDPELTLDQIERTQRESLLHRLD
ncbi:MAG: MSMEG_1061 family FMN-dependent PPOX-type flavoprotein [Thermoleophilaceae bacterium]